MGKHFKPKKEYNKKKFTSMLLTLACFFTVYLSISSGKEISSEKDDYEKIDALLKNLKKVCAHVNDADVSKLEKSSDVCVDANSAIGMLYKNVPSAVEMCLEKNEILNQKALEIEEYLSIYSEFYHFDSVKVIELARRLTNNYEKDLSLVSGSLSYDTTSTEAAVLTFVYQLKRGELNVSSEEIGYSIDDLMLDYDIETLNGGDTLANGMKISEFIGHVCDLLGVDKVFAYAISSGETGWQKDYLSQNCNNFGGMKDDTGFLTYTTPESGVIAFVKLIRSYLDDGLTDINDFAARYCPGSDTWVPFTEDLMWEIERDYDMYFSSEEIKLTREK